MMLPPFTLTPPTTLTPLVVASPHSGRAYQGFAYDCAHAQLEKLEDWAVDALVAGAPQAGAALIAANIPRCFIDLNRAEDDIDAQVLDGAWPTPLNPGPGTSNGYGLIRRVGDDGATAIYRAKLAPNEVLRRIEQFYRPYHHTLAELLAQRRTRFGHALLLDMHSMRSTDNTGERRPDFVIGTRDGLSAADAFTDAARELLADMGYTVGLNDPFKGREILRRHGKPDAGIHALQLEINRGLYMDEGALARTGRFAKLQTDLTRLFREMAKIRLPEPAL